jgi:hypothetical protein
LKIINERLPGGVIGNTGGFGPPIPGSSPGRVDKKIKNKKSKIKDKEVWRKELR